MLGAVLTGGASTRMGRDKAFVEIAGVAMVTLIADELLRGGAHAVLAIGGDEAALRHAGLTFVADAVPGEGPLGGIISALRVGGDEIVVTVPCDMPWITGGHVRALAAADGEVAYAQGAHLFAAWHPSALAVLEDAFAAGERAPKRVLEGLGATAVAFEDGRWCLDVDSPDDLPAT